ncbi:hypothetical protein A2U01_0022536 [Trifolium medium]|uniref:Uncharacterized protein n=1 Tax=Trifolium medium TaxID=97028 RepID=A0A392NQU6_9FABA|nr:hypothetical protein [Trifolium medium]
MNSKDNLIFPNSQFQTVTTLGSNQTLSHVVSLVLSPSNLHILNPTNFIVLNAAELSITNDAISFTNRDHSSKVLDLLIPPSLLFIVLCYYLSF